MAGVRTILETLTLEQLAEGKFLGYSALHDNGRPVVEGGQMMGQMMVAASSVLPGKAVRSMSSVFARPGRTDGPLEFDVDVVHAGRTLASATTSVSQEGKLLCRAVILLDSGDADVIRHSAEFPQNAGRPEDATPWTHNAWGTEVRIANGVDMGVVDSNGPAEMLVWFRAQEAPDNIVANQALATSRSHLFLIGAAMRPHQGIGASMAHDTISTGVLTHTISFHDRFDSSAWLLFVHESTYAGGGRAFGRGAAYTDDGRHIASFSQDSLIRYYSAESPRGRTNLVL